RTARRDMGVADRHARHRRHWLGLPRSEGRLMPMKGKDRHMRRLRRMSGTDAVKAANRVVVVGADMIRAHAHAEISRGSVSGKNHVPSAPGEPPNRDTGHLQAHLETTNPKPLVA